jgi:Ca2+-binding RTX toxin-like protein
MTQITVSATTQAAINAALANNGTPGIDNSNYVAAYNDIYADLVAANAKGANIPANILAWFQQAPLVNQEVSNPSAQGTFIWNYMRAAAFVEAGVNLTQQQIQNASNTIATTVFQTLQTNDFVFDTSPADPRNFSMHSIIAVDAGAGVSSIKNDFPTATLDNAIWGGTLFARTELADTSYFHDFNLQLGLGTKDSKAILAGFFAGLAAVSDNVTIDDVGAALKGLSNIDRTAFGAALLPTDQNFVLPAWFSNGHWIFGSASQPTGTTNMAGAGNVEVYDTTTGNAFTLVGASVDPAGTAIIYNQDAGLQVIQYSNNTGNDVSKTYSYDTSGNLTTIADNFANGASIIHGARDFADDSYNATTNTNTVELTAPDGIALASLSVNVGASPSLDTGSVSIGSDGFKIALTDIPTDAPLIDPVDTPENILLGYLADLGTPMTAAELNAAHQAFLASANQPATQTITFGNGNTLTLDQGSYSSASNNNGTYTIDLITASGGSVGALTLNAADGSGTFKTISGSMISEGAFDDSTTYSIAGGATLHIIASTSAESASQTLSNFVSELNAVEISSTYAPGLVKQSVDDNGTNSTNVFFPYATYDETTYIGVTSVTNPITGQQIPITYNAIANWPYGVEQIDLTHDTISGITELVDVDGGFKITQAQYDEFQAISGENSTLTFSDGGTYSLFDPKFHTEFTGHYDVGFSSASGLSALAAGSNDGTTLIADDTFRGALIASPLGTDTLIAGGGSSQYLVAGGGNDTLKGGAGLYQALLAGSGLDTMIGGTNGAVFNLGTVPAAGSELTGNGTGNILATAGDISKISITGIQTLVTGSAIYNFSVLNISGGGNVKLTADQLNGFSTIEGGGGITAATAGIYSLVGKATEAYNMTASDWGDTTLVGNAAAGETLTASLFGNDTLQAGNGASDTLVAGEGVDRLTGGTGGDTFVANDGLAVGSVITGNGSGNVLQADGDISLATITGVDTLQTSDVTLNAAEFNSFGSITGGGTIGAATGGTYDLSGNSTAAFDMIALSSDGTTLIDNGGGGFDVTLTASQLGDDTLISHASGFAELSASGSEGNDTLTVGDGQNFTLDVSNSAGNNILTAGNGSGDLLNASSSDGNNVLTVQDIGGGATGFSSFNNTLNANDSTGTNHLYAGDGNQDLLEAAGSSGDDILAAGNGNSVTLDVSNSFGDNSLTAGNGTGDFLTAPGSIGNDTLIAGNGNNDRLDVGDSFGDNTLTVGSGSGDVLNASGASGNNTFVAGSGSATITGGEGDNTYVFSGTGTGSTLIVNDDTGSNQSVIQFTAGVSPSQVSLTQSGNDLVLTVGSELITVQNDFAGTGQDINAIEFADGTVWDQNAILNHTPLVVNGSVSLTADQFNARSLIEGSGTILATTAGIYDLQGRASASFNMAAQAAGGTTLIGNDANGEILTASVTGADILQAGNGTGDILSAGTGVDILKGGNGGDTFVTTFGAGPAAESQFTGGTGSDTLSASGDLSGYTISGIETLQTAAASLTADEFAGFSTIDGVTSFAQITAVTGGTYSLADKNIVGGVVSLLATSAADTTLIADDADNEFLSAQGSTGNDTLIAGNGDNQDLFAGSGNDTLIGGNGANQALIADSGNDTLQAGNGLDQLLIAGSGNATMIGGNGGDTFIVEIPTGSGTTITGGSGANSLVANGDITQLNYSNIQTLAAENVTLTASEFIGFTAVENGYVSSPGVPLPVAVINAATAGTYSLAGTSTDLINMNALSNGGTTLIGNDANAEQLTASASGNDTLIGGNGNGDSLVARSTSGNVTLQAGNGTADILGAKLSTGTDTLIGGNGGDIFNAGNGFDTMTGGTGNDTFNVGLGNATMAGGNGTNVYNFAAASNTGDYAINNLHTDSGSSVVDLASGITTSQVLVTQSGNDLVLTIGADPITIQNYFLGSQYQIASVNFADGTVWTTAQLDVLAAASNVTVIAGDDSDGQTLSAGTTGNYFVHAGNGTEDTLSADLSSGNNTLTAGNGNYDTLTAQSSTGNNILTAGTGDGDVLTVAVSTGDNHLTVGNGNSNTLTAGDGTDVLTAGDGNYNTLNAGNGNATMVAGNGTGNSLIADFSIGDNSLTVGDGNYNELSAQSSSGSNSLTAGGGDGNVLTAAVSTGNNHLTVGNGNSNTLTAGDGDDVLTAGDGNYDTLNSGDGNATMVAGNGSGDTLNAGFSAGNNTMTAGTGNYDTLTAQNSMGSNILTAGDGGGDVLTVAGSTGDNTLTAGNGGGDTLTAGNGTDTLTAGDGAYDILNTGNGNATMIAGNGTGDTLSASFSSGNNTLTSSNGDYDTLTAQNSTGSNILTAGNGNGDILTAASSTGNNRLIAGNGNGDTLTAGDGNDTLITGAGVDTLTGGAGNDTFVLSPNSSAGTTITGGSGTNILQTAVADLSQMNISGIQTLDMENNGSVALTASQLAGFSTIINENAAYGPMAIEATTAGTYDLTGKTLTGAINLDASNTGANVTLIAGSADTMLTSGTGVDTLTGGAGNDTFTLSFDSPTGTTIAGGGGTNILQTAVADLSQMNISGIQTLDMENNGSVALTDSQLAGFSTIINENAVYGPMAIEATTAGTYDLTGKTLTGAINLDASSTSADVTLIAGSADTTLTSGTGVDTLTGGNGNDTFALSFDSPTGTTITGGGGTNILQTAVADLSQMNISGVQTLDMENNGSVALTASQLAGFSTIINENAVYGPMAVEATTAGTYDLTGKTLTGTINLDASNTSANVTLIGNDQGGLILTAGGGNDTLDAGAGNDMLNGGAGYTTYNIGASFGQDTVNAAAGGATTANGEIDFGSGITDSNLWFQQSGNDLLIDKLGTNSSLTLADWFDGGAGAQVQSFSAGGDTLMNSQVLQLVSAMASFGASNPAFNPTTATTMPTDTALQSTIAASWQHA